MTATRPALQHIVLSRIVGREVRAADGARLGRVTELVVDGRAGASRVDHVVVSRRGAPDLLVPWRLVRPAGERGRTLEVRGPPRAAEGIAEGSSTAASQPALHLCRDVLDSQVVDLAGGRLSRVSDVLLQTTDDGGLVAIAVDLGAGALLSRMGLRWAGRRMGEVVVAWDDLYLASPGGHRVELSASADRLRRLDAGTVAEVVARLRTDQAADVLGAVAPDHAATVLDMSHHEVRRRLVDLLPSGHRAAAGPVPPSPATRRSRRTSGWRVLRPQARR
ncbi:MAG: PRC-barrel domain-containing protein [Aeromicrobium sp.]